jgi:PhnB protein
LKPSRASDLAIRRRINGRVAGLLFQVSVADSDAVFAQAVEAGAEGLSPMTDMFFGSREGRVLDPLGSIWTISTHKENVSVEEMQRRLNAPTA